MSGLSEKARQKMLKLYLAGMNVTDIAERFSVSKQYPSLLAKRRGYPVRQTQRNKKTVVVKYHGWPPPDSTFVDRYGYTWGIWSDWSEVTDDMEALKEFIETNKRAGTVVEK